MTVGYFDVLPFLACCTVSKCLFHCFAVLSLPALKSLFLVVILLCSRRVLWGFPEPFIDGLLKLLLRFHDTVSADSLDRFLNSTLAENHSPLVQSVQKELTTILSRRSGSCQEDQTQQRGEGGWRKSMHARGTGVLLAYAGAVDGGDTKYHQSTGVNVHRKTLPHADVEGSELSNVNSSPPSSLSSCYKANLHQAEEQNRTESVKYVELEAQLKDSDIDVIVLDGDDDDIHHPVDEEPGQPGRRLEPQVSDLQADSARQMTEDSQMGHNQVNKTTETICCPGDGTEGDGGGIDAEYQVCTLYFTLHLKKKKSKLKSRIWNFIHVKLR